MPAPGRDAIENGRQHHIGQGQRRAKGLAEAAPGGIIPIRQQRCRGIDRETGDGRGDKSQDENSR